MSPPMPDLCTPWAVTWSHALTLCVGDTTPLEGLTTDEQDVFLDEASRWLWRRTGRRYGACTTTITSEFAECGIARHRPACSCSRVSSIDLSAYGPVISIDSVTVDGVPLVETTDWRLVGSRLYRVGEQWPRYAVIVIEFTYGEAPPRDLLDAAEILAVNRALDCAGSACEFPAKTKSVSAEGMSIEVNTPDTWTAEGRTGIDRIDSLLAIGWPLPSLVPSGGSDPATAGSGWERTSW